jgi:hypothetical protein
MYMGIAIGFAVIVVVVILLKKSIDNETKRNLSTLGKLLFILFGMIILGILVATHQR